MVSLFYIIRLVWEAGESAYSALLSVDDQIQFSSFVDKVNGNYKSVTGVNIDSSLYIIVGIILLTTGFLRCIECIFGCICKKKRRRRRSVSVDR